MRKKHLILALVALSISCLSGCHKDAPVTETEPLATIAPETQDETISDKLDDPKELVVPKAVYFIDGKEMSEEEYKAYQESAEAEEEKPTDADGNNIPGGFANEQVTVETNASGEIESYSVSETIAEPEVEVYT